MLLADMVVTSVWLSTAGVHNHFSSRELPSAPLLMLPQNLDTNSGVALGFQGSLQWRISRRRQGLGLEK